ncbi:MAG: multi drug resistance-associated protein MRP [Linnemannia gamsii]|nr:MAG: multi drug resistance-associated protein MRP [Linnemannia gamsii]
MVLNREEHKYSIRSSDFILAYYFIATLGMGAVFWLSPVQTPPPLTFSITTLHWFLVSLILGLVVEAWPRGWTKVQQASNASVFEKANLISRLSFHYIQPIMSIGYSSSRSLQMDDLKHLMPERIRSENAYKDLATTWRNQERRFVGLVPKEKREKERPWLLLRTIAVTFGVVGWAPIVMTRIVSTTLIYIQPVLLGRILDFMMASSSLLLSAPEDAPQPPPQPLSYGIFLAVSMFLVSLMSSVTGAQLLQLNAERGMEIRSGLISLIYRKSLRLSPEARQTRTAGAISNHMSVDAEKWTTALNTLPQWVSAPIELLVALWMLYRQLGWCSLVGLFTVVGLIPIQNKVSDVFSEIKETKLTTMDNRIRLVTEMLTSIKTVKLYAWEDAFKARIAGYREIEMAVLRRFGVVYSAMTLIFSTTMFMSLLSFGIYAAVGGPGGTPGEITPHVIFVSLSLFGLLSKPISNMDTLLSSTTSILVATRRIQAFLLSEELLVDQVTVVKGGDGGDDVVVQDAVLSWHKQIKDDQVVDGTEEGDEETPLLASSEAEAATTPHAPTLTNIDFRLQAKSLTAVVGRIGSGKSSLLNALIGDMYKYQGSVRVRGSVAYVSQQAWILHSTVKDNILFGKPLDQERYEVVVRACCLQQDLDMLPAGDQTEIGERGINLSGGQKQRVALARAAYQDADIYLLDDPLSAVDAHVDQHLWRSLIGPSGLLKDKTRLLITHGLHHLSEVDQIMVMKEGTISEKGSFDELLAAKKGFYQLNLEFSATANKQRRKSANNSNNNTATASFTDSTSDTASEGADDTDPNTAAVIVSSSDEGHKIDHDKGEPKAAGAGLVTAEKMVNGGVGWHMFMVYAKAASYTNIALVIAFYILVEVAQVGTSFWLRYWSDAAGQDGNDGGKHYSVVQFLVIYAAFTLAYMAFNMILFYVANVLAAVRGARRMHDRLLDNLLRQPMAFFDVTPVGRIINRFSTDVDAIDENIIWNLIDVVYCLVAIGGTLIVISVSTPQFLWAVPPLTLCYLFIQSYFLASSQSLKRFMSVSKSPLYQHFSETLAGVSTIRAMGAGERFIRASGDKADLSAETNLAFGMGNRWLKVRLEFLAALIVFDAALLAVLSHGRISASLVGLSLTYAMNVTGDITYLVRSWAEMSNQLISVERIEEYAELRQEAPALTEVFLPENWPSEGRVVFRNYSARYREGLEPVLKNVSFEVLPGDKVGIVGRTGAGKSSLTLALFRMIEAADSYWARASSHDAVVDVNDDYLVSSLSGGVGGSIEIDGVDISTLGLKTLRQHLSIIPQDPTLFAGTVRENLDPYFQSTDTELWTALERAHLKHHISSLPQGLSFEVSSNGENFSVGQRSLICLARALLRKTKILVLDEATAAVDVETDELIQKTIREEFRDRTILTIAHRIKTVMDSDKILVLDGGRVEEFEVPGVLLRRREGLFFRLAEQAGEVH